MQYAAYVSLLSKRANRQATEQELKQIKDYEKAQPEKCPRCGDRVRSQFMPEQIAHDIDACRNPIPTPKEKVWDDE
jgi:hypothetical protein